MRVAHGLYRPVCEVGGQHQDLLALRLVLPPSGVFTHLTAAAEYGWWLPPLPSDLPVFVSMWREETRPQRRGLRVARHREPPSRRVLEGVPLADPAEVLLACAVDLRLLDLVVLCDAALQLQACTRAEIECAAAQQRRGAPMLRRALPWVDGRSESAWETLLRMLHACAGVPVEPQYEVLDVAGQLVARGDLWITGTRVLHEYDGGDHLEVKRQRKDLARSRRLDAEHWIRRGYTSQEVLHQATSILRDADRSLGRPHRPDRVRPWHALVLDSLFTPAGTARLRRRLGLSGSATEADRL